MRWLLVTLFVFPILVVSQTVNQNEIETLRQRIINDALTEKGFLPRVSRYIVPEFDKTAEYLNELNSNGSWASVDYQDTDNNWDPLKALNKILVMAHAYSHPDNPLNRNKKLQNGIESALNYWYEVNPSCVNWYKNEIAKQMYFGVIAILLQDHIDDTLIQKMIKDQTPKPRMTGSNKTLVSTSVFYRGVLEKNPDRISAGVKGVMDQVAITEKEGIQPDYSFHQHGAYLYNGNYGNNFLRETLWLAAMAEGTSFAFSDQHIKILRDYYWEGTRLMLRKYRVDYNVCGRHVGRPPSKNVDGSDIISQLDYFIMADPEHAAKYEKSRDLIAAHKPQDFIGNKHFWRSDYTIHHRAKYTTSLRMCSERTVGVETDVNFENLLGRNIPYGLTYIYRSGEEYKDVFPVWDWAKPPGVTCSYEVPVKKGHYTQNVDFVGGVSDGVYGVSAMELDVRETTAKKSWFWFDTEWVALGAGISSTNKNTIVTGINQTGLYGNVLINGSESNDTNQKLTNPSSVWHDSIGYVFPTTPKNLFLEAKKKSGNIKRIYGLGSDSLKQKEIFTLWYDHGLNPQNGTYEYIVVPGVGQQELEKYTKENPISILANNEEIQAVHHSKIEVTGIVFHKAGSFQVHKDLMLEVDKPCLLLINHRSKKISISDPTAKFEAIKLTFHYKKGTSEAIDVPLPQHQNLGKSITLAQEFDF